MSEEELIKMLQRRKKKPGTKMIRDPYARSRSQQRSTEKTPEQLRQIKLQKAAVERSRRKREAEKQQMREDIARVQAEARARETEGETMPHSPATKGERDAHRKAQQEERERLAMRDSFYTEDDDEYDVYADDEYLETLAIEKDKLRLRF